MCILLFLSYKILINNHLEYIHNNQHFVNHFFKFHKYRYRARGKELSENVQGFQKS